MQVDRVKRSEHGVIVDPGDTAPGNTGWRGSSG
jgi:hypothetical protein